MAGARPLVVVAALVLLQATAHPGRRVVDRAAAGPTPTLFPAPPFDHRPDRTPIPAPAQRDRSSVQEIGRYSSRSINARPRGET